MIRAAFSDFSEGARLRITGEAPPAADLIWGPITVFVAGARAAANLRKNQRKPLNIVRGLEKAKTQFGKRRKRTSQNSWYHREDVEKNKGLAYHARRAAITTTTLPATKPDSPVGLPIWIPSRYRNARLPAILSVLEGSLDDMGLPFSEPPRAKQDR